MLSVTFVSGRLRFDISSFFPPPLHPQTVHPNLLYGKGNSTFRGKERKRKTKMDLLDSQRTRLTILFLPSNLVPLTLPTVPKSKMEEEEEKERGKKEEGEKGTGQ